MAERSLFAELRKRKVVQAAAIYVPVAWAVTEIVVTVVEQLFLPQWVSTLAVIFFVVGFPIAMFLSWTFDVTPDGIQRTAVSSRRGTASIIFSMALLVVGTAGLFLLIRPSLDGRVPSDDVIAALPNSLAILPFEYSGPSADDSYLGPILSDELRDQITRVQGLRVAARSSSIVAARGGTDAKGMAAKLGVAHLLEGNMRRQSNILRVSVQLIDGRSGLTVWSQTFDRGRRELLNVQQDIARAVVQQLMPSADVEISRPITDNVTANEKIWSARYYEQQVRDRETVNMEPLERAIQLYREAIDLDPDSALAHSRLAGALIYYGDIDSAEAPAYRALELDPLLAEAQNTYGKLMFARGRPNMGDPLARAVELNPNLPDALHDYAHWYWFNRGTEGVEMLYRRALELDPLNLSRYSAVGLFLAVSDDYAGALETVEQMQALFDGPEAYRAIAHIYDHIGDVDHAIAWAIRARDAEPDNPEHVEKLAEYFVDIGDFETAEALVSDLGVGLLFKMRRFDEMIEKAEDLYFDYPNDTPLKIYLAAAYAITKEYEQALRVISSSGIMDTLPNGNRGTNDWSAFFVMVNAAYGGGEVDRARELIEWSMGRFNYTDFAYWWVSINNACFYAILGDDAEVRRRFERARQGGQPVWDPMLKDLPCYERFKDDPDYLSIIEHFEKQRAELRARLPVTLMEYDVVL